jgi:hypothetical protein
VGSEPPIRVGEKQPRAFEASKRVRVVDSVGRLVTVLAEPAAVANYLRAPNSAPQYNRKGQLHTIQLLSFGDDRGNRGEGHGNSLVTTERCRKESGEFIGSPTMIKHKLDNSEN